MNFIYPQNLKAKANMWLWSLKDFAIIGIGGLLGAVFLIYLRKVLLIGIVGIYAFMTIRLDESTIMDFIKYAVRYFITTQQYFEWR